MVTPNPETTHIGNRGVTATFPRKLKVHFSSGKKVRGARRDTDFVILVHHTHGLLNVHMYKRRNN